MTPRPLNVLFLCTHNAARSVIAEALLNDLGTSRFRAFSAGSHPGPAPHPLALETLRNMGLPTQSLRSKPWDEFAAPGAPAMDFIITVCDNAAGEICPVWPGQPVSAHWGVEDPTAFAGDEHARRRRFAHVAEILRRRITALVGLNLEALRPDEVSRQLREIELE